ncbi:Clp protease N-terminal domain-containing protein [Actinopolymorpha sp. B9G3]|uniref:Clp protease N-terminal domain-containing protein n=1 Tax=Actinopolymorpha sp. B9G3 TaxID=3158970 RepID=UPI0032D8E8B7
MAPAPSLHELIETVRTDAASDDVLDQLAAARAVVAELSETGDAVLGHFVDRARGSGRSWTEISKVLGVTKQAVHKRFTKLSLYLDLSAPTFERFTPRARRAFDAATEQARALGHSYVGTEHLLLGLQAEPDGVAAKVLAGAGAGPDATEAAVLRLVPRQNNPVEGELPHTPRAKGALAGALAQAIEWGHNYIGTEHLLLGLYREPQGLAARVLTELGLDADSAETRTVEILASFQTQQ